jgi:hypothetical protein
MYNCPLLIDSLGVKGRIAAKVVHLPEIGIPINVKIKGIFLDVTPIIDLEPV